MKPPEAAAGGGGGSGVEMGSEVGNDEEMVGPAIASELKVVRVKRKREQAPIENPWLEVSEPPSKPPHEPDISSLMLQSASTPLPPTNAQINGTNRGTGLEVENKDSHHQSESVVMDGVEDYEQGPARKGTDLTNLLHALSEDSGDSEDQSDFEYEKGFDFWPEFPREAISFPHTTTQITPLDVPSEQTLQDGDAGSPDLTINEEPPPEVVVLDSDSDDEEDLVIIDQPDEIFHLKKAVKLEPGSISQVSDCDDAGDNEGKCPVLLPSIPISGSFQDTSPVVANVFAEERKPSPGLLTTGLTPGGNVETKPTPGGLAATGIPHHQSGVFQALTMDAILRAKQEKTVVLTKVQVGKPTWGLVAEGQDLPSAAKEKMGCESAGHTQPSGMVEDRHIQAGEAVLGSTSPQPDSSSGEQASSSQSEKAPTTTAVVPYCDDAENKETLRLLRMYIIQKMTGDPIKFSDKVSALDRTGVATPSSSQERISPASEDQPDHAEPSAASPTMDVRDLAGVTYPLLENRPEASGVSKVEPDLYDNQGLGPQNCPVHNQLVTVKPCYDSTVSTPRVEVARALQKYYHYINKAKLERLTESARRASSSNEPTREESKRGLDSRPDIIAYNGIRKAKEDVNTGVIVGDLPGIEVGDRFTYRHQMAVVGLHRRPYAGIDYGFPPPEKIATATAIVLMPKAGYVDDVDNGHIILYTGQGGRKKQNQAAPFVAHQKLVRGNLALVTNHSRKLPVRVIRGHSDLGNHSTGVLGYTYDGLYIITDYQYSAGLSGLNVFKFSMERLEDQPPIPPCIQGCTAHKWNDGQNALGAQPLQAMDPSAQEEMDVKRICGVGRDVDASGTQSASPT